MVRPAASSLEASNTPAQCLYLADPYRLAVLGIKITAQASLEGARLAIGTALHVAPVQGDMAASPQKASSSLAAPTAPPSSYRDPGTSSSSSSTPSHVAYSGGVRSRPRSAELGARAKEAFLDLGRGVSNGLRNLSKSDITDMSEGPSQTARTTDDRLVRRGSKSGNSSAHAVPISSPLLDSRVENERGDAHARQIFNLRPHSLTFGGPGPSAQLASTAVGLHFSSRIEASLPLPTSGSNKPHWERLGCTQTEFVRDIEAQPSSGLGAVGRAGVFSAVRHGDLDSEASDDDNSSEDDELDAGMTSSGHCAAAFDPLGLLLKVTPPLQYLRQHKSSGGLRESTSITIKARLRLGLRQSAEAVPHPPRVAQSTATSPPMSRTVGRPSSASPARVIFVSAYSSKKLFEAVESSRMHHNGAKFSGPLSSADAARLEGIEWVPVEEADSCVVDFEWKWKEIGRGSAIRKDVLGERNVKCVCAFVELSEELKAAHILTSFSFLINLPVVTDKGPPAQKSDVLLEPRLRRTSGASPRLNYQTDARAVGLGLASMDPFPSDARSEEEMPGMAVPGSAGNAALRTRRISGETGSPLMRRRVLSPEKKYQELAAQLPLLLVDHTEINLADVEDDGPILRAALQNLDRKTTTMKRTAKAILKTAAEVRANLHQVQTSKTALEQSMEQFGLLAPSTLGFLNSCLLHPKRVEAGRLREQEREMIEAHVETPLRAVVDMCRAVQDQSKLFESESKGYYTATQKWLSTRTTPALNGKEVMEAYSPAAVGFDKASLKQERVDDKQRLRQARFHLARLEMYRVSNDVHGGEAELQLASHYLALCRWQCVDEEATRVMKGFETAVQTKLASVRERGEGIRSKCNEVERLVNDLQLMLSKGHGSVGGWETEGEAVAMASSESEHTLGAATRQAGMKIKGILTSLGSNKQAQNAAIPPVPSWDSGLEPDESPTKANMKAKARNKGVVQLSPSIPAPSGVNSFAKLQQRLRPASHVAQEATGEEETTVGAGRMSALTVPRLDSLAPMSPMEIDVQLAQRSPSPRRSLSVSGGASPGFKTTLVDYAFRAPSSPTMNRHGSNGMSRASSDSQRPLVLETGATQSSRTMLLQPRRAAQQSRKKEGILWAMSKPIVGAAGSDAPKAVSRSQNWRECWVVLSGSGHLGEYADWKDIKVMEPSQPLIDLRFAAVREARRVDRRFTFEIVTRDCRRFFQASNEQEMREWMGAIGLAIESLLNGTSSIRQIEKVARVAGGASPFLGAGDEFGSHAAKSSFDVEVSALGQHRAFSQSLTDLSSATTAARLFHRGGAKEDSSRKKDGRGTTVPSGHLSTLSEGGGGTPNGVKFPSSPHRSTPWIQHERGISNKTPVSGYVQQQDLFSESKPPHSRSSSVAEPDYDRKIEEMVHSSYGGSSASHRRSGSLLSAAVSRQASQQEADGHGMDKYSRAKEILDIAARPMNSYCADCRSAEPKWASWSLNGEPRCIFLCITCSGFHRSLGVSVSRVKSVELDDWTEEQMNSARRWGNELVNEMYEARKPIEVTVATYGDAKSKAFWTEKYVERAWYEDTRLPAVGSSESNDQPAQRLSDEMDDFDAMEAMDVASDIDESWDGSMPAIASRLASSSSSSSSTTMNARRRPSSSPPPSQMRPASFASALDGSDDHRKHGWRNGSSSALGDGEGRASLDSQMSFPSLSPPLKPSHFARFPRKSLERRSQPATSYSPSLAA